MTERTTPFDHIFRETGIADAHFPAIQAALPEGAGRDGFVATHAAGELLRAIAPDTGAASAQIALLAYHAFQHWRAGARTWSLDETTLRSVLAQRIGDWTFATPADAGYFQLPRHRVWVASDPASPAEAVDGFFWAVRAGSLELLLVLGMHEGRTGISVVELAAALPPDGHWGDVEGRGDGQDFAGVLPGGEHLLGLRTAGEVLKLATRVFHHLCA